MTRTTFFSSPTIWITSPMPSVKLGVSRRRMRKRPAKPIARLEAEKKKYEEKLEASKIAAVEAFKSSTKLRDIKVQFSSLSYIQAGKDLKAKLKKILHDFDLELLESNDEEVVAEGGDEDIRMEDLFSPTHEDQMIEQATPVLPPTMITLSNHAEVR
ncbi:hypothetical protein COCNU_scaffold001528G000020 [Cocos nucifera]|nr:hypothetical protein [Cocos nucifera]